MATELMDVIVVRGDLPDGFLSVGYDYITGAHYGTDYQTVVEQPLYRMIISQQSRDLLDSWRQAGCLLILGDDGSVTVTNGVFGLPYPVLVSFPVEATYEVPNALRWLMTGASTNTPMPLQTYGFGG